MVRPYLGCRLQGAQGMQGVQGVQRGASDFQVQGGSHKIDCGAWATSTTTQNTPAGRSSAHRRRAAALIRSAKLAGSTRPSRDLEQRLCSNSPFSLLARRDNGPWPLQTEAPSLQAPFRALLSFHSNVTIVHPTIHRSRGIDVRCYETCLLHLDSGVAGNARAEAMLARCDAVALAQRRRWA